MINILAYIGLFQHEHLVNTNNMNNYRTECNVGVLADLWLWMNKWTVILVTIWIFVIRIGRSENGLLLFSISY